MKVWYPVHSQINLKNCSFYILDGGGGFTHIGHVNGDQSAGLTGVDLTSVTSAEVAEGDLIAFETNPTHRYLVKGFATNIVTIAPALVEALSAGDEVYVIHNPENIEIKIGEGDLTYTEHHARTYTKDRGRLDTVRDADEEPMDVAFQLFRVHEAGQGVRYYVEVRADPEAVHLDVVAGVDDGAEGLLARLLRQSPQKLRPANTAG